MHGSNTVPGLVRVVALSLVIGTLEVPLFGGEVNLVRTNWADRWITNLIEVRMPANHFVNEYHTNWVTQLRTNVVDVYATNRVTRTLTNQVVVDAYWTNLVVAYQTNWNTQLVTNIVQVAVPAPPTAKETAARAVVEPKEVRAEAAAPAPAAAWVGPLAIDAARTSRAAANNLAEVQLKLRWTGNTVAPLQVQTWRVEREDGGVLLFGQEQEFKRPLPVGNYKVEAKLKAEGGDPPLTVRGTLSVTLHEATIQPNCW
jgi:hypothetical protein